MKHDESAAPKSGRDDVDLTVVDILLIVARHKRVLIAWAAVATLLGTLVAFVMPPMYRATTTVLPPQQSQSSAAALLSQLGGAAGAIASATGIKNPSDLYVGLLKSRTIGDRLVSRFNLTNIYDETSLDDVRRILMERTSIGVAKDGIITVSVEDREKKRSAELANAYVDELVKLTKVIAVTEAGQRRLFFERQLEAAKNNLASAEMLLKKSLDKNGVVSVDVESRAIIETTGRLRAAVSAKEIQFESMKPFMTPANPEYRRVQQELLSLRAELDKLNNGRKDEDRNDAKSSSSGLSNIKILRDLKYQQMLYEVLSKQYEMARLDESRDASVIQVLDTALVPERKLKPKRSSIIVFSFFIGVLVGFAHLMYRETMASARGGQAGKWAQLRTELSMR